MYHTCTWEYPNSYSYLNLIPIYLYLYATFLLKFRLFKLAFDQGRAQDFLLVAKTEG